MRFSVFTDTDWLYPDSQHSTLRDVRLDTALGGHAGVQILGDHLDSDATIEIQWSNGKALSVELFQLMPVGVNENTSPTLMTTTDYESCKHFVTRKAPFYVYDALKPISGKISAGCRFALYLCIETTKNDIPGIYGGNIKVTTNGETFLLPLSCNVHNLIIPELKSAKLGMLNFFDYDGLATQHQVEKGSAEYWELFRQYVRAQILMHCTHILLPAGEAIYVDGKVVGFDFTSAEKAGQIALEEGAVYLCGGHIAHWHEWDESEYYPNWDQTLGITTSEGYLQMRLYFSQWADVIHRNQWESCMTQALADEPQTHNDRTYRILASMCRKFLPGIPIIDAVETTNLGGGIDIWVPKQDTYEKWRDEYEALKAAGEEMWFYTCAFPAGPAMNRSMDLPLTVSRVVLWMGAYYRLSGFLHWGFNYYIGEDIWNSACCPHKGALLPAGDAHIVYPGSDGPWRSMRFEAQRSGAEDYEIIMQALAIIPDEADKLILRVCKDFRNYTHNGVEVLSARKELLKLLEQGSVNYA